MYIPKRYGQSRKDGCPFCGKLATQQNSQGIPVCVNHKNAVMNDVKCMCGGYLDIMTGKYGVFFNCMSCGNLSLKKVMELNKIEDVSKKSEKDMNFSSGSNKKNIQNKSVKKRVKKQTNFKNSFKPKEIEVRSDDPMYFD